MLSVLVVTCVGGFGLAAVSERPNIVLILVDDQGYYDLSCYGATDVHTPRIDAMAGEGVRFTDYYAAAPICSPSRAALLTGCYPRRLGLESWVQRPDSRLGIQPDGLTLAELYREHGYATACIGKWHLGAAEPSLPENCGFDYYFGLLHNLDPVETMHFEHEGGVPLLRNGQVVKRPPVPAELARLYTDEAIDFIERNREKPFFLYLPHTWLHGSVTLPQAASYPLGVSDRFRDSSSLGLYGDMVQELDYHTGRLLDALDRLGLVQRTIVVYVSDNGRGPGRTPEQPIRGHKLQTWEGGIRVPGIVWGPGAGIRRGHVSAELVHAMDWYPTLATLAGIRIPDDVVIDGRDISPLLTGITDKVPWAEERLSLNAEVPLRRPWQPSAEWAPAVSREEYTHAFLYHSSEGALAAVRWDRWKLHLSPELTLYDLVSDPGESNPVRGQPDIRRKLRGIAVMFQQEMNANARSADRGQSRQQRRIAEEPRQE